MDPLGEIQCTQSFFNLEIELLIEGMPGADLCVDYKSHEERGYKQEYTTNEEAFAAKQEFNSKTGRERRRERRKLSDEEIKRVSEQQKRQTEDEKEISRRVTAVERGRREKEKEEMRLRKEALSAVRQVRTTNTNT